MKSYKEFIGEYNGFNCFIIGTGPSLYHMMKNDLFNKLSEYGIIITINSSIMAKRECDIWLSNDYLCTRWTWWKDVINSNCIKIVRNSWMKHKDEIKGFDRFYIFKPRPTSEDVVNFEDEGLVYCSSVPSAIDFSIQAGCKNIFLLGVDQYLDKETGYHHFWQFFPKNKQPKQLKPAQGNWSVQKKVFEYNGLAYRALQKFAIYKKCKIYNCNKDSNVNEFDKIDFNTMKGYII